MPKLPGVTHRRAVRALEKLGFTVRREGKHIVMSDGRRIVTIPRANPVNAFTMGGIVRDAGFSIDEIQEASVTTEAPRRIGSRPVGPGGRSGTMTLPGARVEVADWTVGLIQEI